MGNLDLVKLAIGAYFLGQCACSGESTSLGSEDEAPAAGQRRFDLRILGSRESLALVDVPGLESQAFGSGEFTGALDSWEQPIVIAQSSDKNPTIELSPWLCPSIEETHAALESGGVVTESRIVELDEGKFWTNGRLGQPFPTSCQWSTSSKSGSGLSALQDGPSLCTESDRKQTMVHVVDESGRVVSVPQVCVARFGDKLGGTVGIVLSREKRDEAFEAMTLSLTHCLAPEEEPPFEVDAEGFRSSDCRWEGAWLSLGEVTNEKPRVYPASEGTWRVEGAAPSRDSKHKSVVDLRFALPDGSVLSATGEVELPQILE